MAPRRNVFEHVELDRRVQEQIDDDLNDFLLPQTQNDTTCDAFINMFVLIVLILLIYCSYVRHEFCSTHNYQPEWCKSYLLRKV